MKDLTDEQRKILDLIERDPGIIMDTTALEEAASELGISLQTLQDQLGALKRDGLLKKTTGLNKHSDIVFMIKTLLNRKRLIIKNFIIVFILSAALSLIIPKTFRVSALIMPPAPQQDMGLLGALTSSIPLASFGLGQSDLESNTFLAILNSRTVMDNVVRKFELVDFYNVKYPEKAIKILRNNVGFEIEDEGTISLTADVSTGWLSGEESDDRIAQLATDIANYFITNMDSMNKRLKSEQARFQRLFIEKRYEQNIEDIKKVEEELSSFQEENKTIALPEQTEAAIKAAATIQAQILADEVTLGMLTKSMSPGHPAFKRIKNEISQLEAQLKNMETRKDGEGLFPGFSEVPALGIQLLRMEREMEIQNILFTFLTQQYEEAKILEAKNTPTLQVIDWAVKPEKKHKPKRVIFVLFFCFLSVVFTSLHIIFKPAFEDL